MNKWPEPELTDQVVAFYSSLAPREQAAFDRVIDRLAELGPALTRPTADVITLGRDYPADVKALFGAHLKELRPTATLRIFFTFGPTRVPVLLFAGSKEGEWTDWYPRAVKEAARLYREYLEELREGR